MTATNYSRAAIIFALSVAAIGSLVLLGWQFDIEFFKRPIAGQVAMNPAAALGFVLSGIAFYLAAKKAEGNKMFAFLRTGAAITVILIGVLKLADFIFDLNIGVDNRLFNEKISVENMNGISNRMAPSTAFYFILAGSAVMLSASGSRILKAIANYFALLIFLTGLFLLLGYVYNVPEFTGLLKTFPVAIHTVFCFLFSTLAIFLINYNNGFMRDFTGSEPGRFVVSVFIPVTFGVAIALGFMLLFIHYRFSISHQLIVALGATSVIICSFFISWFIAGQLNKINSKSIVAEKKLLNANTELSLAHELFLKIFQSSPVATNIMSVSDGRIKDANDAFLKLFSFTREQVIGKTSVELKMIDAGVRKNILQKVKELGYTIYDLEIKLRDSNGEEKDILSSTQTIELNGDLHMLNTLVDITERKETEELVKKSNERFFKIFNSSPVPTTIADLETGYRFVNDAFLNLFLFSRKEVIGKTSAELNIVDAEGRTKFFQQVVKEKGSKVRNIELKMRDKNGNPLDILSSSEIIELGGGNFFLSTMLDITERKHAEELLRKSNERFFQIFNLSPVATSISQIETGSFIHVNDAFLKLFSFTHAQIIGKNTVELNMTEPELRVGFLKRLKAKNYHLENWEVKLCDAHGNVKDIISSSQTTEINGETHLLNTFVDITERKQTEEKLKQYYQQLDLKNKELEQFAFVASHDLQEPLRTISSFTELLTEEYEKKVDENANTYIRFISQSAIRMRDLISGLLEYSRLGSKRILTETDCNEVLKNTMMNLHATITQSHAVVKAKNLPVLNAYPLELELLFQNLIGNAIKFRKKDVAPEVHITAEKIENEWQFSFADNGIGIDPKYAEKIFLLFQRLHSRDTYEGTGIGLAHCKKIVELHNGKIRVESKQGEGSVFHFTIPEQQN